jgi:hypothetical protein
MLMVTWFEISLRVGILDERRNFFQLPNTMCKWHSHTDNLDSGQFEDIVI